MQNIWHWQQYLTCYAAVVTIGIYLVLAAITKPVSQFTSVFFILIGQWVLWTGGWYGN